MKFKFRGTPVELIEHKIVCKDPHIAFLLSGVITMDYDGPEEGDYRMNNIISIYGLKSISDIEEDIDPFKIY